MRYYLLLLLLTGGWLLSQAPVKAQAPRLVRERVFVFTNPADAFQLVDGLLTPQGTLFTAGPNARPLDYFLNRFLFLSPTTLDTVKTLAGVNMPVGGQSILPRPNNQLVFAGMMAGTAGRWEWGIQVLSATGQIRRTTQIQNPGGSSHNFGKALNTSNGGLFWAGTTEGAGTRRRAELLRTDSAGIVLWQRGYGWSLNDYQTDAVYTNTGTILLAGVHPTGPNGSGVFALRLLEVNQLGDSLRGTVLAPRGNGRLAQAQYTYHRLLPLADGGFALPCDGDTTVNGQRLVQPMLLKTDRNLNLQWLRVYRSAPLRYMRYSGAITLADGSILVLAYGATGVASFAYSLHHYSLRGQWIGEYPLSSGLCSNPEPIKLIPDVTGRKLYIIGQCVGSGGYTAILDLGSLASAVTATSPPIGAVAAPLLQLYPNPATDQARVQVSRAGTLCLFDALGRLVRQQAVAAGATTLDVQHLPTGLYACQLVQDGRVVAVHRLQIAR